MKEPIDTGPSHNGEVRPQVWSFFSLWLVQSEDSEGSGRRDILICRGISGKSEGLEEQFSIECRASW